MNYDSKSDGYALLDWVADNNAVVRRGEDGDWQVVCAVNGAVLGQGNKPSAAIISAANNKRNYAGGDAHELSKLDRC